MNKTPKSMWYKLGIGLIITSLITPVFILTLPFLPLSLSIKSALAALLALGIPEVLFILGVALAGKEAGQAIKAKVKKWFKRKTPPKAVSKPQYYAGIGCIVLGAIVAIVMTYLRYFLPLDLTHMITLYSILSGNILIIIGFFVAGDPFWEKFKKLFRWDPEY